MIELTPALKPTSKLKFSVPGKWENNQPKVLHDLAESFNIDLDNPPKLELTAIPDMWARPLLFKSALFDSSHIIHKRIVGEWRGLLTILALQEVLSCKFDVKKVVLDNSINFSSCLKKLSPVETLHASLNWDEHYLFLLQGQPIGMSSPATLVFTAAEYRIKDVQRVAWVDMCSGVTKDSCGDRLIDPLPYLNPKHKQILANWLITLKDNLVKSGLVGPAGVELLKQLNDFIEDVGAASQVVRFNTRDLGMSGILKHLYSAVPATSPGHSAVKVVRERQSDAPDLLVVDEAIAEQWDLSPHEIIVNHFSHLGLRVNSERMYNNQPLPPNTVIMEAKALLTDKLHLVAVKGMLPGAYSPDGIEILEYEGTEVTPLIPLSKELLNYFSSETLHSMIRFEQPDMESIRFILTIPLSGMDGQKDFRVEKTYRVEDIVEIGETPVCSIWPNFKTNAWRLYYSYYSTQEKERCFYAVPYVIGHDIPDERRQQMVKSGNVEREIIQLDQYPDTYVCSYKGEDAGIILIREPSATLAAGISSWRVGVDFGTTGTNVSCLTNSEQQPKEVTFKNRYFHITSAGESYSDLYRNGFHNDEKMMKVPFLTIYKDSCLDPNRVKYRPLLDGNIYFMRVPDDQPTDGKLVENLKWDHTAGADQIKLVQCFIKQICIQTLAEAAASNCSKANWLFSYPAAFSTSHSQHFRQTCEDIIASCSKETGIDCGEAPDFHLESVAAANYFHHHRSYGQLFSSGALSIDIGGGTSDISLWQQNHLINQTSVKLAGRKIFNDLMVRNQNLMAVLYQVESKIGGALGVDVCNRDKSSTAMESIRNHWNDREIQTFTTKLLLGISSILYYAGLIVRHKVSTREYSADQFPPEIFIAGGGANILHWIAGGKYNNGHYVSSIMKRIFLAASGLSKFSEDDLKIQISTQPKFEAAQGLVYDMELVAAVKQIARKSCLAGESFNAEGKSCEWNDDITAQILASGATPATDLKQLKEFLDIFNSCCIEHELNPLEGMDHVLRNVARSLPSDFQKWKNCRDTSALEVEPIFVLAFKKLLDNISGADEA